MRNKTNIPERLRSYSAAELHKIANALDMEAGKHPQMTLITAADKAKRAGVNIILSPEGITLAKGASTRRCKDVVELMIALRLGPVFFDRPLWYRGEPCTVTGSTEKGIMVTAHDKDHFVWYTGAERVLSNYAEDSV